MCALVTQSRLTLCDTLDCNPPGSSVHGIFQARILEWVAISSSRGSSQPRDQTCGSRVSCIAGISYTCWSPYGYTYICTQYLLCWNCFGCKWQKLHFSNLELLPKFREYLLIHIYEKSSGSWVSSTAISWDPKNSITNASLCALISAFLSVVAWINIHKALRIVFGS